MREVRRGWRDRDQLSVIEMEAPRPTLQGRGVELAVIRTGRRRLLPRVTHPPSRQPADHHRPRIPEAGHHPVVEGGHHLPAAQAPPALLADDPLTVELDQRSRSLAVPRPPVAATPRAARSRCRWYARPGSLPAFGAGPASTAPEASSFLAESSLGSAPYGPVRLQSILASLPEQSFRSVEQRPR
jgi:hypothetical protein